MDKVFNIITIFLIVVMAFFLIINNSSKISGFGSKESISTYIKFVDDNPAENGKEIPIGITVVKVGDSQRRDLTIHIYIQDDSGEKVPIESQTIAVETKASIITLLKIPENVKSESYEVYVEVTDVKGEQVLSTASQHIYAFDNLYIKVSKTSASKIVILAGLIILFVLVAIKTSLFHHEHTNKRRRL